MPPYDTHVGEQITAMQDTLAGAIVERHYHLHPELEARYGARGRVKCIEDAHHHLNHLSLAMATGQPEMFRDYIAWAKAMLDSRGIPASDLADHLRITIEALKANLPNEASTAACRCVETAMVELPQMATTLQSHITSEQPLADLAEAYIEALLACRRHDASKLVLDAVQAGTSIKDIYIHVFQQTQHEIGRLWQVNQITVAQEHYCTAATQMIMSQLYPHIFTGPRNGRCFVGACVDGDLHEIGIRMVCDFFEMNGWDTIYLGANVPITDLIQTLKVRKPHVVGISVTTMPRVAAVTKVTDAIHAEQMCGHVKVLVGGRPFNLIPELWKHVGADGNTPDASSAVELANQWVKDGAGA